MNKKRLFFLGFFVVFIAAIFYTPIGKFIQDKLEDKSHVAGIKILNEEDYNIDLKGYNGALDENLQSAKNSGQVVLINFWGSWCPPCVKEMPSLQELYNTHHEKVKFIFIAIQDKPNDIINFAKKHELTLPLYEPISPISVAMMPKVFPTTYILNKKGEIVLHENKTRDWNDQEINALLEKLIKE
ncbi:MULTISPECIES: TlpA family protein disulfide reductase [Weeksella]|uniref:Alkyl hydroperoxide reductase/ Thiol specific antioxidant/ Mal allergen n=1 Tax=Weeksella virosa (strain ATCC 43766 / DSM 16922 / JCM 21250 / CCUG 30538 / CDC 9751 / IAM 14551 / NBRC 16016 / NCTC 11634 / CL345/78) TaxID=865938 RepID=F0P064_WEEVC|nr:MULTISPECIES: TlpA disulfide reductase family protein [Weeksella]ADX68424.1 alkyl hydroperoxide reductase/ Thiol specific antioxidant/ Mal allergen [Weeksella virosa DSM 16922]MDK7375521.1 TlpA disulfide reductase family protein [Weeksella virosa]MDK7674610.1 TlpA disulfide reductase family protein [Weeksella virosa]OFM84306.1 alkyl hydroperoxide reductase [Weeksella sp. HMSC059D05]SUP54756.1 Stage IV sporulation protein H [Weeksella virosa]